MTHQIRPRKKNAWISYVQLAMFFALVLQFNGMNTNIKELTAAVTNVELPTVEKAAAPAPTPTAAPTPTPNPSLDMVKLADDDPVKGDKDAPVTIVEWSDFECPFCARFYRDTYSQIIQNYIDTGKAKLVFRDYPLSFHPNAQKAAEASECADDQGKFWEMHDKIFENQGTLSTDNFKAWAVELGLDATEFNDCLDSGKHAAETAKDLADGSAAGIRGTPGFIINGQLVSGAQPYANFAAAIDAALAS